MRKIVWNNHAKIDYYENIDFLLNKWSETEAQKFIDQVSKAMHILSKGSIDFCDTDLPGIKYYVLRKQITIFYKINSDQSIEILRFWNNKKDKRKLKL